MPPVAIESISNAQAEGTASLSEVIDLITHPPSQHQHSHHHHDHHERDREQSPHRQNHFARNLRVRWQRLCTRRSSPPTNELAATLDLDLHCEERWDRFSGLTLVEGSPMLA